MRLFAREERLYLHPQRLADVLALIQVLALDEAAHRSESGLREELQAAPRSAKDWGVLAAEHPEFFRVRPEGDHRISLLARHVIPRVDGKRPVLSGGHVESLLRAAIDMHDRQVRRADRWTFLIPIWVAVVAGLFSLAVVLLKYVLSETS